MKQYCSAFVLRHSYFVICTSYFVFYFLLPSCVPLSQQFNSADTEVPYYKEKRIRTDDHVYENNIKTVLFYPFYDTDNDILEPPIIFKDQNVPLILEYDELGVDHYYYNAKIIHCNADWSVSLLNEMDYLYDYNQFIVDEYQFSFNTKVQYIHYKFELPKVKLPGNYVLIIYREDNEQDMIISRRFMVYDNIIKIVPEIGFSTGIAERNFMQQVNFNLSYKNYEILNPREEVRVVIRQNHRWDNAIYNLKPLYVREEQKLLEYNFFDLENNFKGGNEYRDFDIRSIRFLGRNLKKIDDIDGKNVVTLLTNKTRSNKVYSEEIDINGKYIIDVYEYGNPAAEADYVYVNFKLHSPQQVDGNVYIFGGLSNWKLNNDLLMFYRPETKKYTGQAFLKQGYYNYIYVIMPYNLPDQYQTKSQRRRFIDETYFEGSYYSTENIYDILVYYKPIGSRADLLLGYISMNYKGE